MAVYLAVLIAADNMYMGNVLYVAFEWKPSLTCNILAFLIMLSFQSSMLGTFILGIDRFFLIVIHPFKAQGISLKEACTLLVMCWAVSVLLSLILCILDLPAHSNNACLALYSSLYVSPVYCVLNLFMLITTAGLYMSVIRTCYCSAKMANQSQHSLKMLIVHFTAAILVCCIQWLTIGYMTIMSLGGFPLSTPLQSLIGLVLFPLASLLNPIINTFSTRQFLTPIKHNMCCSRN
jgi:hypothetical protein